MLNIISLRNGQALAVYQDRWRPIYEALGALQVQRASEVEFDAPSGEWIATHKGSGQIIGRGRIRSHVIAQEVAWLEAHGLHPRSEHAASQGEPPATTQPPKTELLEPNR